MSKRVRYSQGYRLIYEPGHQEAMDGNWEGYVYEHIIIAERMLGRSIKDDEEVHHMDFDRSNNSPNNLLVLTKSQHVKLHNWLKRSCAVDEELLIENEVKTENPEVPECKNCRLHLSSDQEKYCSRECYNKGQRRVERPSKSKLKSLIDGNTWEDVSDIFDVSSNTIRNWAEDYGIK